MNEPRQQYVSERVRRERSRGSRSRWSRWLVVAFVVVVAFAVGTALGVALERGPGAKGIQTRERTLQIVTVTVTRP